MQLAPKPALFAAMLERRQPARFLWQGTIAGRMALVRRLAEFPDQYSWKSAVPQTCLASRSAFGDARPCLPCSAAAP